MLLKIRGQLLDIYTERVRFLFCNFLKHKRHTRTSHTRTATMYVFLALISIATLYSGKSFGKSCDSADAKPLLQRLDSDEEGDSPFTAENNYYTRSERKISEEDAAIL